MLSTDGRNQLISDEGKKPFLYDDKTGERVSTLVSGGNPTIGIGRNLGARALRDDEIMYLFNNDVTVMWADIARLLPWLGDAKQQISQTAVDVVIMVEFNTGDVFAFRNMLAAIQRKDYKAASVALLDSAAARQLPERYNRMAAALIAGTWKPSLKTNTIIGERMNDPTDPTTKAG